MLKTGELSKKFEIDRTSLNYYIRMGLLDPKILDNQYRAYSFKDVMALSHIRYYLGLGFKSEDIKFLTREADHDEKLECCEKQLQHLENEIKLLQMKKVFLEHFMNTVRFHQMYLNKPILVETEGYYFIPQNKIEDVVLKEVYKMIPSNEFEVDIDEQGNLSIQSKFNLGLALKEEWVKDFGLIVPNDILYYPPKKKCLCSYQIKKFEDLQEAVKQTKCIMNEKGISLKEEFTVYLLLNNYSTDELKYDVFAQFELKDVD